MPGDHRQRPKALLLCPDGEYILVQRSCGTTGLLVDATGNNHEQAMEYRKFQFFFLLIDIIKMPLVPNFV